MRTALSRLIVVTLLSTLAFGHAIIVESTPKAGGVISGPALDINLRFNLRVDGRRSRVVLVYPDGKARAIEFQQPSPERISGRSLDLPPGNYHIHWQVLANDGHITQGDIPFTVVGK
jgi:hypothetical protein